MTTSVEVKLESIEMTVPNSPVEIMLYATRDGLWKARIKFGVNHTCYIGPDTYSSTMYRVTKRIDYEIKASGAQDILSYARV